MKLILSLIGVVLLVVAAVYFLMPADQLPSFMPGHEAGVTRMHTKHGIVAGAAGIVCLVAGWWVGRRGWGFGFYLSLCRLWSSPDTPSASLTLPYEIMVARVCSPP